MTESEAKTKWCPFARPVLLEAPRSDIRQYGRLWVPQGRTATFKEEGDIDRIEDYCIGSQCMAWRATDNEIKSDAEGPIEYGRAMKTSDYVSAGYCGLAGKG